MGGEITYFGLDEWWLHKLSEDERDRVRKVYSETWDDVPDEGDMLGDPELENGLCLTVTGFLIRLAGHLGELVDKDLRTTILAKAEECALSRGNYIDLHFLYQDQVELCYANRAFSRSAFDEAMSACRKHVAMSEKAAQAFAEDPWGSGSLPLHLGFNRLLKMLEETENFEEAVRIAEQVRSQGWAGSWDRRIKIYRNKLIRSR